MRARTRRVAALTATLLATLAALSPGCRVGYLVRSGVYQAELLLAREPVDELVASGRVNAEQQARLALIRDTKTWGREIGLQATDNYETVAWEWQRQIWNVSACQPTAFEAKTWWFPIVGRVPYLGYFREEDARALESGLVAEGWDVYVRTAGAYSTLGWFKDPILPKMLTWDDFALADTVIHELAHATLWVPGSVKFNESFANFVGEVGALRYLMERRGHHDPELVRAANRIADLGVYRELTHQLYLDLDTAYTDPTLDEAGKLAAKAQLFAEFPARVEAATFAEPARYIAAAQKGPWNNARLIQFKTYNTSQELFARLLEQQDGDLLRFIQRVGELTRGQRDPFKALEAALGPVQDS